ncbi:Mediator of RNA polymerase II transcription subunit 31 [Tetrabaena socialis]|uniref:Mediator of RNA polymerase II transcription subunit 31 n=1 Tax=Tetrabaena socialis TaxID=47790 RepID=A0A2J8AGQ2_9CHLO|nr:Mediator of RNA polymerase II transcription subunit 31 [Tetrabaena socialis]|eukprot:PNH11703.1 Mediator of RNA polymerase II transcription subunit 31 [Tetrabaena socialis]
MQCGGCGRDTRGAWPRNFWELVTTEYGSTVYGVNQHPWTCRLAINAVISRGRVPRMVEQDAPRRTYSDAEIGISGGERFALELEFIQCLANPLYINWLATKQYLENQSFINYLKYLQYWKQPAYARYITYPHCLFFLDLLQDAEFRSAIKDFSYAQHIRQAQETFFTSFHSNRVAAAAEPPASQHPQQ